MSNPSMIELIIFVVVSMVCIAVGLCIARPNRLIAKRVRELGAASTAVEDTGDWRLRWLKQSIPTLADILLPSRNRGRGPIAGKLSGAGIYQPLAAPLFVVCCFAFGGIGLIACFLVAQFYELTWARSLFVSALAMCLAASVPHLWLSQRCAQRRLLLRRAIPDFLDLVVACLGGGLSIQASLRQVADELQIAHPQLSAELGIALGEMQLGCSLDQALQQLATRTGLDELKTLRSFIHQSTKFGTTITDALGQLAEMLRFQREQRAEELAQKAAVKILFPVVLFIFPTLFVILAAPAAIQIRESFQRSMHQQASAK